ncbi:MAG: molybdopterin cofactor-binding domain-containing protein [Anaerolineaceae bacterium]|nr:molybdopterin cofactor-binding domain-containing protein [Anaerolineaceae bacterium]
MTIQCIVNGSPNTLEPLPGDKLSDLLRRDLGLTGTKVGCGEGRCGICMVLMDGKPTRSCITPAQKADGTKIITVEGLRQLAKALKRPPCQPDEAELRGAFGENLHTLHPLQEAFIRYGAIQCGFCTPGQLIQAYALLQAHPHPSSEEIREAMNQVLCRCGSYQLIEEAIQAAALALRTGQPIPQPAFFEHYRHSDESFSHVGKPAMRPDAVAKACGSAKFTDDLRFEGMLYARVLRAGLPSAILQGLETRNAQALAGVHAVLTAADLPAAHNHGLYRQDWPILVGLGQRVRYQGDALALVAAETQAIADEAITLMEANLQEQPPITSPQQALGPSSPQLHPQGNLLKHIQVRKGSVAEGFAQSDLVIESTFTTPFAEHFFMEPECSIAVPLFHATPAPTGDPPKLRKMEVYTGSQIPYADRQQIAQALGLPEEDVRVLGQRTGGGFGGKEDIAGQIHAALLARATGRPVKLLFTRRESMLVHPKRHAASIRVKLGAKREGSLLAAEIELYGDTGAYASLGDKVMTRATTHSSGPYIIPHVSADCYAAYTNNPPAGAFRGFGVMQSSFAIESAMDQMAGQLGMDPLELRLKNALRPGTETNTGQLLESSVGLVPCLQAIQAEWGRLGLHQPFKPQSYTQDGRQYLKVWGLACAYKNTGLGAGADDFSGAEVKLLPGGRLQVSTAAAELGQGMISTLQIIAAEILHLPLYLINVFVMDTELTLDGGPTTASRQTFVSGNAVRLAALQLRERLFQKAAELWGLPVPAFSMDQNGIHYAEKSLSLAQLYEKLGPEERSVKLTYHAPATEHLEDGRKIHIAFSFAAQAVELRINKADGEMKVLRVLTANDAGRIINPLGYEGQSQGGVVMGVGTGLMEEFKVENGRILSDCAARYPLPRMQDTPAMTNLIVEDPMPEGPFGAKGIGEIVSIPTPPAIANAIFHATGLRICHLPIRPDDLKEWLKKSA